MSDLIDRQAAIDAVRSYYDEADTQKDSIEERIEQLPSVQPEVDCEKCIFRGFAGFKQFKTAQPDVPDSKVGKWIPCSEKLPLYNMRVLVIDKYNEIDIAELVDYSDVDEPDEWWTYEYKVHDIIAWMPLPEHPGKERKNEGFNCV